MSGDVKVDFVNVPAVKLKFVLPFDIITLFMNVLFVERPLYDEPKRQAPPLDKYADTDAVCGLVTHP